MYHVLCPEAAELAKNSDIMLVVGGRHSSNTVKLFEVCSRYCKTYHIENSDELRSLKLPNATNIGITAGASTPAYIIKEVQTKMAENEILAANQNEEFDFAQAIDESFKKIHTGEKVKGIVIAVNNTEAIVDLGTKHTGYVALDDLTDDPSKKPSDIVSVGDEIELVVIKVNDAEGTAALSKRKVDEQAGYEGWYFSILDRSSLISSSIFGIMAVAYFYMLRPLSKKVSEKLPEAACFGTGLFLTAAILTDTVISIAGNLSQ